MALAALGALVLVGCGDDPKSAEGDELPLLDGAEVVQSFEEPNGVIDATVLFQVVTHPDIPLGSEVVNRERAFLADEGWSLSRDEHVPQAWVAEHEDSEDFIRLGTVNAMRRAAMGHRATDQLTDSSETRTRSMVVQISPPGPPQPE